jgi:hypothetical protein
MASAKRLVVTGGTTVMGIALHLVRGARFPRPDLRGWLKENQPAIESSKVAESVR